MEDRKLKYLIIGAIFDIITGTIVGVVTYNATKHDTADSVKEGIVESLSDHFDWIDEKMTFDDAMDKLYTEIKSKDKKIEKLNSQVEDTPDVSIISASVINNGIQESEKKEDIIYYSSMYYYSQEVIDSLLQNEKIKYLSDTNQIIYNSGDNNDQTVTKISFNDVVDILYDGECYNVYKGGSSSFTMGGKEYHDGFLLKDDHSISASLSGSTDGYALFNLDGNYSKMEFLVGRTNNTDTKENVTLNVYLDGNFSTSYSLKADDVPKTISIDLKYANSLKLEIVDGSRVCYGFAEVVLYY